MLVSSIICWRHYFFCNKEISKNKKTIDENSKYRQRKSSYLLNDGRNLDEIFRKDVTYENIKSQKKAGLHILSPENVFLENS